MINNNIKKEQYQKMINNNTNNQQQYNIKVSILAEIIISTRIKKNPSLHFKPELSLSYLT